MKISLSKDGKQRLVLQGKRIALQTPDNGDPLMIEADMDDGSPIKIMIDGRTLPIRRMTLVHKDTYRVKSFIRHTSAGEVRVPSHDRRKPYRKMRAVHKSI